MTTRKPQKRAPAARPQRPQQVSPPNMAEKHVDAAQRQQAMEFMKKLMAGGSYIPIVKALKQIGVEPHQMDVMIGDEPEDCLVIPMADLMMKEWRYMSEIDALRENMQS